MLNYLKKINLSSLTQLTGLLIFMLIFGSLGLHFLLQSHASTSLPGDINNDGIVNEADLQIIRDNYGQTQATANQGDLNGDGVVDILDASILFTHWGSMSSPQTSGKNQFGIATGAQGWPTKAEWNDNGPDGFKAGIDDMANAGAHWIRMSFPWNSIDKASASNGCTHNYDFTMANNVASYTDSKNIKLIVTISQPPDCDTTSDYYGCNTTSNSPQANAPPDFDLDDYAAYAGALAADLASYPNVQAFEMGNEPNHQDPGKAAPNACEYTVLARKAYAAIRAVDPSVTILNAGLAGGGAGGSSILSSDFLSQMYAENGGNSMGLFDAFNTHAYSYPNSPSQDMLGLSDDHHSCNAPRGAIGTTMPGQPKGWCHLWMTRQVMIDHGDRNKKTWITEYGVPAFPASVAGSGSPLTAWSPTIDQNRWRSLLDSYLPQNVDSNGVPLLPIGRTSLVTDALNCGSASNPLSDTYPHCSPLDGDTGNVFLQAGSANTQSTMIAQAYKLLQTPNYDWVGPMCYFTFFDKTSPELSDNGNGDPNGGDFMGLVDFNGNHKPAYDIYKSLVAATPN